MRLQELLRCVLFVGLIARGVAGFGQVGGNSGIHDPSRIIKEGNTYHVFSTGDGISHKFARDIHNWSDRPRIFATSPDWVASEVPANEGTFWAPSVIKHNDEYRLYYSVSSFGSQDSAIGLAINTTLNDQDPNYQWVDQGAVIDSEWGYPYNAIDPSIFYDENTDRMWMTFGSFWDGVFMTELNPDTGRPFSTNPSAAINIARNPVDPPDAIEAPYLHERDGYYYLFVNWGSCCQGVNSTYEIRVGRSTSPTGPFFGREDGDPSMRNGGGTLFLGSEGNFIGPGHMSIYSEGGVDSFGYHFYDAGDFGAPKYNVETLSWTADGWPIPASDLIPGDFNGDYVVDDVDLEVWSAFYGDTVDGGDFLDWQRNLGSTTAPGAVVAVPEPSVLVLSMASLLTILAGYPRRRRSHE